MARRRPVIIWSVIPTVIGIAIVVSVIVFARYGATPEVYRDSDLALMWETEARSSDGQYVSTHAAQAAAARVFEHVQLKGLSRDEVIKLVGDPERSNKSMYNFPFYPVESQDGGVRDLLVYRFDTGHYGWQFNVWFREGRVSDVEALGIE